jgi:diketogulonate reductase-like aldo/keto reductase
MVKAIPEITLNDGLTLPVIGLGTYKLKGNEGVNSILNAIDIGYRLIEGFVISYLNISTV